MIKLAFLAVLRQSRRRALCFNAAMRFIFSFCCLLASTAFAQQPAEPLEQAVMAWLGEQTRGLPGEVEIQLGKLDSFNRLAPCKRFDISRPPGARPWGRGNLLIRCLDGAAWRVYLPVDVRVKTDYLVVARPLTRGQMLAADDLTHQVGDLGDLPGTILTDPQQAIGKVATTPIPAGQPLRSDMLKAQTVIRRGQTVKVVSSGPGFAVANEGRALGNVVEGELAQVRLPNGQVVSGIAEAGGSIRLNY